MTVLISVWRIKNQRSGNFEAEKTDEDGEGGEETTFSE